MKPFKIISLIFLFSSNLFANDTAATVGAGGIQFKKNNDISMDSEILKISTDAIHVDYLFTNHSDKDLTETFAFPLPPAPHPKRYSNWDESAYIYKFLSENSQAEHDGNLIPNMKWSVKLAPFLNFSVSNDGDERTFNYRIRAHDKSGKDITDYLQRENIPLSSSYLTGYMEEPPLDRMKALKEKLRKLDLLNAEGLPNWTTTTTYFWDQWFQKKSSRRIGHAYRPAVGYHWMTINKDAKGRFVTELGSEPTDYCIDQKALSKLYREGPNLRADEVHYIVTTAKNWSGPIKKFRLEIEPIKGAHTFFCWDKPIKRKGGRIISEATNYVPSRDLRIIFLRPEKWRV